MVVETPRRFYLILSVWKNCSNRKNVNVFVENIFVIIIKIKKNLFECLSVFIFMVIFARNYIHRHFRLVLCSSSMNHIKDKSIVFVKLLKENQPLEA